MAEIIGVAASATQLGAACFSLIDLLRKIKGGASTLKRYHEQLQELQSLSTCISQNPLLQTPEIGSQTRALLTIIDNNCIESLLRKGRFLRTWGLLYREQDLFDIFVRLEQQKSNLSLAIEQIQSKALYQIQTDIQNMADEKALGYPTAHSEDKGAAKSIVYAGSSGKASSLNIHIAPLDPQFISTSIAQLQAALVTQLQAASSSNSTSNMSSSTNSNEPVGAKSGHGGPQWNGCEADPGFHQENRRIYKINGPLSKQLAKDKPIQCIFNNSVKMGRGNQNNRHYVKFVGDVTDAVVPNMDHDQWNNVRIKNCPTDEAKDEILGTQFNGIEIEYEETVTADAKTG